MSFTVGSQVMFEAEDGKTYTGTYQGVVQPLHNRFHVIQVESYPDPNWVRVGSERELAIHPLANPALDQIAEAYNSSTTTPQDIVNAVGKALHAAGYELRF